MNNKIKIIGWLLLVSVVIQLNLVAHGVFVFDVKGESDGAAFFFSIIMEFAFGVAMIDVFERNKDNKQ